MVKAAVVVQTPEWSPKCMTSAYFLVCHKRHLASASRVTFKAPLVSLGLQGQGFIILSKRERDVSKVIRSRELQVIQG